jgi:hypothetical protein
VCLSAHRCTCVEKKTQPDVTECFIALMICSTCFGHFYAHHQQLETICVITAYGVQCLVTGCWGSGAEQHAVSPERGMLHDESCWFFFSTHKLKHYMWKCFGTKIIFDLSRNIIPQAPCGVRAYMSDPEGFGDQISSENVGLHELKNTKET